MKNTAWKKLTYYFLYESISNIFWKIIAYLNYLLKYILSYICSLVCSIKLTGYFTFFYTIIFYVIKFSLILTNPRVVTQYVN